MKNIWTIALKDFKGYFTTPIAYIVGAFFMGIMGWMFFFSLSHFNMQQMQFQMGGGRSISITDGILRPVFGNMNVIYLFTVPLITMRLVSEEKKQQTFALLATAPVTLWEIVTGKFLAALLLIGSILAMTLVYPGILFATGNPEWGPILTCYLGTLFMAGSYIAMGIFFSSVTENQIVAAVSTLMTGLFFWLISWASTSAGPVWGDVLNHLSLINHFNSFSQGVINTSDVIYYVSFIFFGLFLSHRVLDSYRWR
jgi:ABC-2 type transport system permease protein